MNYLKESIFIYSKDKQKLFKLKKSKNDSFAEIINRLLEE